MVDPPIPSPQSDLRVAPSLREKAVAHTECPRADDNPGFQIGPYHFAPTNCDRVSQRLSCRQIIDQIVDRYNR